MKHPALLMRGTPLGTHVFQVTDKDGKVILTSKEYQDEDDLRAAAGNLADICIKATENKVDQLPSTIAHK